MSSLQTTTDSSPRWKFKSTCHSPAFQHTSFYPHPCSNMSAPHPFLSSPQPSLLCGQAPAHIWSFLRMTAGADWAFTWSLYLKASRHATPCQDPPLHSQNEMRRPGLWRPRNTEAIMGNELPPSSVDTDVILSCARAASGTPRVPIKSSTSAPFLLWFDPNLLASQ